jgi:ribonuclease HI
MEFYVDGACSGNGSANAKGGFGVLGVEDDKIVLAYSKRNEGTTNNREELRAILYVVIKYGYLNPTIHTDSAYAMNTLSSWMYNWARNGWLKSDNKTPENLDLIKAYYDFIQEKGYKINFIKVKGHSNNKYNNIVDNLATGKVKPEELMR